VSHLLALRILGVGVVLDLVFCGRSKGCALATVRVDVDDVLGLAMEGDGVGEGERGTTGGGGDEDERGTTESLRARQKSERETYTPRSERSTSHHPVNSFF
jgi:hypothetical protein